MKSWGFVLIPGMLGVIFMLVLLCQKPSQYGLALERPMIPAPFYHQPLNKWKTSHTWLVKVKGQSFKPRQAYFSLKDCLACHKRESFCAPCHLYVGTSFLSQENQDEKDRWRP